MGEKKVNSVEINGGVTGVGVNNGEVNQDIDQREINSKNFFDRFINNGKEKGSKQK